MATGLYLLINRCRVFGLVLLLIYLSTLYVVLLHLNCFGYLVELSRLANFSTNDNGAMLDVTSVNASKKLYKAVVISPDLNVFFTVKTTPKNYQRRIGMSKMTWFQYVDRRMVRSYRRTYVCKIE